MTDPRSAERVARLRDRLGGRLAFGGDYNPEQWPELVWAEDVKLMQQAGVNLVTVGVFSWAMLEPSPGEYDFGWMDRVLDLLHDAGIAVDLATATASPPPWLGAQHPQTLPVTADGVRLTYGSRQHYCPSSPVYRDAAAAMARRMAERYGTHPALALWHVNNEYGCHVAACYCDVSAADFRGWLQRRYGDIETLNEAWGTAFWSQRYGDWSQVLPPRHAPYFPNPAQQLDFRRFSSDALLECYRRERDVLREVTPDVAVMTNFMGLFKPVDYWKWAAEEDIVANDSYPDPADPVSRVDAALAADLMRSLRGGQPWLLMEQAATAVNWRSRNKPKPPGGNRLLSMQAVARGADAVMYFQWRAGRSGAEKFHSGMLPHGGPDTRTYREVEQLGEELTRLADVVGTRVPAQVALVLDWPSWWGLELDSRPSTELRLGDQFRSYYAPLWLDRVTVDLVNPESDLSAYRVVCVPNLYLVTDAAAAQLVSYVQAGGHLVISFFSGIVDEHDAIRLGGYPAPFRDLLGLRVEEFWPLAAGETVPGEFADGTGFTGELWSDAIDQVQADVLARYTQGELAGRPAVTRRATGDGTATYVGTRLDPVAMRVLLRDVYSAAGVRGELPQLPDGVEAVRRGDRLFVLNHTESEVAVPGAGLLRARDVVLLPAEDAG